MEKICREVGRAAKIISDSLAREKQVNTFLKNIDPVHFELCLRATYLNHYPIHTNKEALEVVSACIFQDLKRETGYFELLREFRGVFVKLTLDRFSKFCLFFNKSLGMPLVAALSIVLAILFFSGK